VFFSTPENRAVVFGTAQQKPIMLNHHPFQLSSHRRQALGNFKVAVVQRHGKVAQIDQRHLCTSVACGLRAQPDQFLVEGFCAGSARESENSWGCGHGQWRISVAVGTGSVRYEK
jgi:hypothetical protein